MLLHLKDLLAVPRNMVEVEVVVVLLQGLKKMEGPVCLVQLEGAVEDLADLLRRQVGREEVREPGSF